MKIELNVEIDDRLLGTIYVINYTQKVEKRYEHIPQKSVVIDGVTYQSEEVRRTFIKTKEVATIEEWDFDQLTLDEITHKLHIQYATYLGCGETEHHYEDAIIANDLINKTIFFNKSDAYDVVDAFNKIQTYSEEVETIN